MPCIEKDGRNNLQQPCLGHVKECVATVRQPVLILSVRYKKFENFICFDIKLDHKMTLS